MNIEKKTAGTFIYGVGNIEVEILQLPNKEKWNKQIELFVTQNCINFQVVAMHNPRVANPLFLSKAIQAFINHIQQGTDEQTSGQIMGHFRNWLRKQNLNEIINGTKTGDTEADRATSRQKLAERFNSRYS